MTLTPLAIGALALLNERPMHPYEMYQTLVERHEDRLIKVRPGSLYHAVERLEAAEFVKATGTEREGNRPERTTYAITKAGNKALKARITEVLSNPVNDFPVFPVALSEAHNLPAKNVIGCLKTYLMGIEQEIAEVGAVLDAARSQNIPEAYWIAGDYLLTVMGAKRDWIITCIERTDNKELIWQPHKA